MQYSRVRFLLPWDDQMLNIYFLRKQFHLSREKKFPQPPCKSFSCRLERTFISHEAVTQSLLSKPHLFTVSFSREFSKLIKAFAAGFTLVRTVLHDVSAGYNRKQFGWKLKMSVRKNCKCALEILKNIVENRASVTSEQVIVSYPREILSQPLWESYSYVREFLSFLTMWQSNVSFGNFLCLFPYF